MKENSMTNQGVALMALALDYYRDRPGMYVRAFGTNRIVRMTYIWKLRVERGLEDRKKK